MAADFVLAAARFVHYAAAIQLFGLAAFHQLISPAELRPALRRAARPVAIVSGGILLISAIVWLMAAAAGMGDGLGDMLKPDVLGTVLSKTAFGRVWEWRIALCAIALAAACLPDEWAWWPIILVSMLALGSLGLIGHAAVEGGSSGLLHETSEVLHLLSSGFWLGALLPLLACLTCFQDAELAPYADRALRRFSGLGHLVVALLLATGAANTWFVLGFRLDPTSTYQRLLLLKVTIAGAMCGLAIINRYVFMPKIPNGGPGARQLARGTIAEIVLGGTILGLVATIGMLSPR